MALAFAVGALVGIAFSYRPTPTPLKASQQPQNQSRPQGQNTQGGGANAAPPSNAVSTNNPGNAPNNASQPNQGAGNQNPKASPDWGFYNSALTTLFNGILALVTILLLCVGRWQAVLFKQQNKIMRRQTFIMNGQLKYTEKAANAAQKSADAIRVIHRQWIHIGGWRFETWNVPTVGLHAQVIVEITNKTPLPLTIFAVRCYINGRKAAYSVADAMLPPGVTTHQTVSHLMNERELAEYSARRLRLVVAGWVHYWDAFGDIQSQIIGVCLEHIAPGVQPTTRGVSGLMRKMPRMEKDWPIQEMLDWMEKHEREKDEKGEW
jgi:hypothetical protein